MPEIPKEEVERILRKYKTKLDVQLAPGEEKPEREAIGIIRTREYKEFKEEYLPKYMSYYERACNKAEKFMKINPSPAVAEKLKDAIDTAHLNVTPTGVYAFAILGPMLFAIIGFVFTFVLTGTMFFPVFLLFLGLVMIPILQKYPFFLATNWRIKASNQMVLCVFYIVTYMRHTSNIELAIDFAADHLRPPLSLDMKKVIWRFETGTYDSVKESLTAYLETWRQFNMEFIESINLVIGSMYETSEERRLSMLDKSLDVILDETYEKMLHYAQNLKSPITMLHMLGIILPILTLVILPLIVSFMEGLKWYHLAVMYDFILPVAVYYLGVQTLAKRPSGYGDVDISKDTATKELQKITIGSGKSAIRLEPLYFCLIIGLIFFLIALTPIFIHKAKPGWDYIITKGGDIVEIDSYEHPEAKYYLIGYKESAKQVDEEGNPLIIGPYGIGAALISVFLPLCVGLPLGLYFMFKTKNLMSIRDKTKKLEQEFASALFQLGNRLGDGYPAEIAFGKVAATMQDTTSGKFCQKVSDNIQRLGMSVEQAIYDPTAGALKAFPSDMIETSMRVLIESVRRGPRIAAEALINVSRYIKEMHRVEERLKDLMSDIISSMKSQIKFLTPVIAGIVMGITSMVTSILNRLGTQLKGLATETAEAQVSAGAPLMELFGDGLPTFFFQIVVGFYVIEIVYVMTYLANGIENGVDKLNEKHEMGENLTKSTALYCFISLMVMLIFNLIAGKIIAR